MKRTDTQFSTRLARDDADLKAAQRLRYKVFVQELGSDGPLVDHDNKLEQDRFDAYFDHLLLIDEAKGGAVVGVYRVLRQDQADAAGQFYSADEFDLSPLLNSDRKLLELGRSCVDRDYRGGAGLFHLWQGLADYVLAHEIDILFGSASIFGTDIDRIAPALSFLHHRYLAPEDLRVRARVYQSMDLIPADRIDRIEAMKQIPALIKSYLRLGGFVGDGAYVDQAFGTTDVCLIMDTARMNAKQRDFYVQGREA